MTERYNMYGCTPCPKCLSKYRCVFVSRPQEIYCDECDHREPITPDNHNLYDEVIDDE